MLRNCAEFMHSNPFIVKKRIPTLDLTSDSILSLLLSSLIRTQLWGNRKVKE